MLWYTFDMCKFTSHQFWSAGNSRININITFSISNNIIIFLQRGYISLWWCIWTIENNKIIFISGIIRRWNIKDSFTLLCILYGYMWKRNFTNISLNLIPWSCQYQYTITVMVLYDIWIHSMNPEFNQHHAYGKFENHQTQIYQI